MARILLALAPSRQCSLAPVHANPATGAELVLQTACLRPVTPDNALLLGKLPALDGAYIATGAGRQGIMRGPAMAKAVADPSHRARPASCSKPTELGRFAA